MSCVCPGLRVGWRIARLAAVVAVVLFSQAAAWADEPNPSEQPLPLKRVVLFSSSVGYFEHAGQIEGDRQIEFSFKTSDINDLLKSLVVQDHNGGLVTAVNYGSPEPVTETLRTFTIDLTDSPTLAQIFAQLRGQKVELQAPDAISGTVVGVETRKMRVSDTQTAEIDIVNLRTESGLASVRVDRIERTKFSDPKIDSEFQKALDLLAAARSDDQKKVKLDFRGAGQRNVSVGYIQEAPLWKTSYRLVLKDNEAPLLQGWAIVDNTTAQDWDDVQLTLVSGRPISFVMDLHQPQFLARPFVTPEGHASLRPRVYDQDLGLDDLAEKQASMRGRGGHFGGGGLGGMGGGFGGGGFGGPSGGEKGEGQNRPIDLTAGVASAATGEDVGELFRYVIKTPVSLPRNESAMLPIVNDPVKAEKLVIYNQSVHIKHPLAGLRLTNTTKLHLLQGPITLFDGDEYAGDARIEDIAPQATRLISYALDLETEIAAETKPTEQVVVAMSIREGGLHLKQKATRNTHYTIKNASDRAKQVLIERPIDTQWNLVEPEAKEQTRNLRRFEITAEPGKTTTLVVSEEQDSLETQSLTSLDIASLQVFVAMPAASPALKKALQQAIELKSKVIELSRVQSDLDARLTTLVEDQERVRRVYGSVPPELANRPDSEENVKAARALRQRYLSKLAELETEIEKHRVRQQELAQEQSAAQEELAKLLKNLVAE